MKPSKLSYLLPTGLLALATACGPSAGTVEKKSESTTRTNEGTVATSSESTQVGTTLEAKTETKTDSPTGTVKVKTETFIGTVTAYTAGKKVEVLTGEKKTHGFDLDDKSVVYFVDPGVAVGKHVTVVDETGGDKVRRISVTLGS